ncbi:MAG: response regulator [Magnetococcus sp. XQGC-1]
MKILTNIPFARTPLLVWTTALLTLVAAVIAFYLIQKENLKSELQMQLLGIGNLKVGQINNWVEQYYRDGLLLTQSSLLPGSLQRWMESADFPAKFPSLIAAHLLSRKTVMNYQEILVVRPDGTALFSTAPGGERHAAYDEDTHLVQRALLNGEILFSPIHAGRNAQEAIHLDMVVPVSATERGAGKGCAIILRIDVQNFLFPLVSSWPSPTVSAETLLAVRDGDEVLFLNQPRFWHGGPLNLRWPIPATGKSLVPAVRGIMGEHGIMEGLDYRGVPVLAATIPLTRLPWIMVSKIDQDEAYSWLWFQSWAFFCSVVATFLLVSLWWVSNTKRDMQRVMDRLNLSQRIAHMGCWDWDPHADQESWSRGLFTLFGLDVCQPSGNRLLFQNHIHPEERQQIILELHEFMQRDTTFDREYRIIRHDGTERFVQERGQIFRNRRGRVFRVLGVLTDITERKKTEEFLRVAKVAAEEANQVKEIFLANMSHELRTPLNAIITLSELAIHAASAEKRLDYIKKIKNSSGMLSGIIQDILDLSKIRSGKLELESVPFYLEDVLANLATILGAANKKKLRVLFRVAERTPRYFRGDPLRLGQILLNLMSNAIKFTQQGFVLLSIHVAEVGSERVVLHFAVTDTGCGITDVQMQRIFQPFVQGDKSIARRFGGTGLGLAICQNLVSLMHGTLHGSSKPGQGSTFSFSLAFDLLPDPLAGESNRPLAGLPALLVDDHPLFRQILVEMLLSFGMHVYEVEEGAELYQQLEQWQAERYPLTLLFWNKESHDALYDLCRRFPPGGDLKYFLLASGSGAEVDALALALNLDVGLAHPFTAAMLQDAILNVIGNRPRAAAQVISDRHEHLPAFPGARILVVDDMEINRLLLQDLLQREGCVVTLVEDGHQAVAQVERQPFDLVFMDLQMSGLDGLDATRQIRKIPGRDRLPIISMTASDLAEDRNNCLESGMNDLVSKPLNAQVLNRVLQQWLPHGPSSQPPLVTPRMAAGDAAALLTANLPGFDVAAGLASAIDNPLLYRILLRKFRQSNLETAAKVHAALRAGEHAQAKTLVHGLVGVAGHLGAHPLTMAAQELEKRLLGNPSPGEAGLMEAFALFQSRLEEVLTALRQLEEREESSQRAQPSRLPDREKRPAIDAILETLVTLLAAQDVMEGMQRVEELRHHLVGSPLVREAELLMEQLFHFDWAQAQQTLARLQQTLHQNP